MQRHFWLAAAALLALPSQALAQEAIKVGQVLERTFPEPAVGVNPSSCYEIDLAKGQEYIVTVAATGLKPSVSLMASGCKPNGVEKRTGFTGTAQMTFLARNSTMYLIVESTEGQVGDFAMQVRLKPPQLMETQPVQGKLDVAVVCYRVRSTGLWMVTRLTGPADAKLAVFDNGDCSGKPVASDNDDLAGGGTDARVVYRQVTMKDHSVQVSRWGFDPARDYTLVLRTQMDPPADAKLKTP